MKDRKLLQVNWLDHCSFQTSEWREEEEYDDLKAYTCTTVGFLLREDEEIMILVQTIGDQEDYGEKFTGDMCILKKAIINTKELK